MRESLIQEYLGVNLSNEEIEALVESHFNDQSPDSWAAIMGFISSAKGTPGLRWASPLEVKLAVEKLFTAKFGAKEAGGAKSKTKVRRAEQSESIFNHPLIGTKSSKRPNCILIYT
jgi:hypothetical protein